MPNANVSARMRMLDCRYTSPQSLYALADLQPIAQVALFALLLGPWWFLLWADPWLMPLGKRVVLAIFGFGGAAIVSKGIAILLLRFLGGYTRHFRGFRRLTGAFEPGRVRLLVNGEWLSINTTEPHQFSMREHSERIEEARAEEQARAFGYGQQPDYFRRSFEIFLDHGLARTRLAEIAFEDQARDIVRQLHELDAYARSTSGAGTLTRTANQPGAVPLGKRPSLD
ncbi:hypothetical protein M2352_003702 [Azospirillum fermentarium]|uniref:hypothetical protein n=1 Tax=Azospirillum fermentarium TaxID=1233114 RepID=UPI002226FA0F|nr:hypothetical protein [Azospirillum fermentarium]MCW2248068.1 hypothetical protein [Azospirillum fermentarium]